MQFEPGRVRGLGGSHAKNYHVGLKNVMNYVAFSENGAYIETVYSIKRMIPQLSNLTW